MSSCCPLLCNYSFGPHIVEKPGQGVKPIFEHGVMHGSASPVGAVCWVELEWFHLAGMSHFSAPCYPVQEHSLMCLFTFYFLAHSLAHSLVHSLAHSLTFQSSLTHPLIGLLIRSSFGNSPTSPVSPGSHSRVGGGSRKGSTAVGSQVLHGPEWKRKLESQRPSCRLLCESPCFT